MLLFLYEFGPGRRGDPRVDSTGTKGGGGCPDTILLGERFFVVPPKGTDDVGLLVAEQNKAGGRTSSVASGKDGILDMGRGAIIGGAGGGWGGF